MKISINNIYFKKPTYLFYAVLLISILFWFLIRDVTWRHIDDYGPLENLIEAETPKDFLKLTILGWGSYPPVWQFFSFLSYIFKPFGIEVIRNVCFFLGILSIGISSFLTYSICFLINKNDKNIELFEKNSYSIEVLSILFNFLNPEILLHSNSNMPYNLGTITIQSVFILILVITNNIESKIKSNNFFSIDVEFIIIFTLFSLLFTFQSSIIVFAFLSTVLTYFWFSKNKFNIKYFLNPVNTLRSYNFLFKKIDNKFKRYFLKFSLTFFILTYLLKILLIVFYYKLEPGYWANGINDIYKISNLLDYPFVLINKLIFNLQSIITQSIYPTRFFQAQLSFSFFLLCLYTQIRLFRKNIFSKYFFLFSILTFFYTILLALSGKFIFSPTRHTIFLYPIIWIPIILAIVVFLAKFKNQIVSNFLIIVLFAIYFFSSYLSIAEIKYSKNENTFLINLLKESDFIASKSYLPYAGNISLHGNQENKLTDKKKCITNKVDKLNEFKIFVYSYREPFIGNEKQIKYLIEENKECFLEDSYITVLKKFEKNNIKDIEQNNLIYNGGSSLYAYILRVRNI